MSDENKEKSEELAVCFALGPLEEPVVSLLEAGRVYLTMEARRVQVETQLMEEDLWERQEAKGAKKSDDGYGFHSSRE